MLASKLLSACGGEEKLFVDEVFSSWLYTGNGSTQTITNGIDLAGKGGLVWIKSRSDVSATTSKHAISDTIRGATRYLVTNESAGQVTNSTTLTSFNSDGFSVGLSSTFNKPAETYASWTFRKSEKFFDCGTYTGNGVDGRQIPHSLGVAPGMVIVKCTNVARDWAVWHRSLSDATYLKLNTTEAAITNNTFNVFGDGASQTSTHFTVGKTGASGANGLTNANASGDEYVWYAFAHDSSADGIVQCGSFTTTTAGNYRTEIGYEPQWLLVKRSAGGLSNWLILDTMRGFTVGGNDAYLEANSSNAEINNYDFGSVDATGFTLNSLSASSDYIYLAIRRPNKPPTTGTQVYNAIARTGTGAAAEVNAGFPADLLIAKKRAEAGGHYWWDRLRGSTKTVYSDATAAEATVSDAVSGFDSMLGAKLASDPGGYTNTNAKTYINHFFKRAPGVFDQVCYTGTGSATTVAHSLGVAPELMIVKGRGNANNWEVYYGNPTTAPRIYLNTNTTGAHFSGLFNDTAPTASVFTVGTSSSTNASGIAFVAYLFATKAGISKVGSYTGNGGTQTIDCGFTTGARFVLIKRTDSTGDWKVFDTARGIVAGNDPRLHLNTTNAEDSSEDLIDPVSSGFAVNQTAGNNLNVNAATYIYLAFA